MASQFNNWLIDKVLEMDEKPLTHCGYKRSTSSYGWVDRFADVFIKLGAKPYLKAGFCASRYREGKTAAEKDPFTSLLLTFDIWK